MHESSELAVIGQIPTHEPWHGLGVERAHPNVIVHVRLFGQHAWKVAFCRISCWPELLPAHSYHLDPATGQEVFAE